MEFKNVAGVTGALKRLLHVDRWRFIQWLIKDICNLLVIGIMTLTGTDFLVTIPKRICNA